MISACHDVLTVVIDESVSDDPGLAELIDSRPFV